MKVSNLYISQVKRKCGIEVGKNYNLPKNEDSRQPQCPGDKESAIVEALKHCAGAAVRLDERRAAGLYAVGKDCRGQF